VIAGHFGLAAAVKGREPAVPLWALMLATVWLDVVFVPLMLLNIETMAPVDGMGPGYGHLVIHADYTHSLVGAMALSALFGGAAAAFWGRRTGVVLAAVVFSHWLLDLVVHRQDMPWLPGNAGGYPRLGLGLWRHPAAAAIVELLIVLAGAWLYWSAARALGNGRTRVRAKLVAALVLTGGLATLALDVTGILG